MPPSDNEWEDEDLEVTADYRDHFRRATEYLRGETAAPAA